MNESERQFTCEDGYHYCPNCDRSIDTHAHQQAMREAQADQKHWLWIKQKLGLPDADWQKVYGQMHVWDDRQAQLVSYTKEWKAKCQQVREAQEEIAGLKQQLTMTQDSWQKLCEGLTQRVQALEEALRVSETAIQGLLDEIALCRYTKQCEPLMVAVVDAEKALEQANAALAAEGGVDGN